MDNEEIKIVEVEVKKPNVMIKILESLGKWFTSLRMIIEKSKKYDQVETIFRTHFESKFQTYKLDGDRVILRELMILISIADQIGLNGSTSQIRDEIVIEHNKQLEERIPSTKKIKSK